MLGIRRKYSVRYLFGALAALLVAVAPSLARAEPARALGFAEALSMARRNAPQVREAFARAASADARVGVAKAVTLPTISATGTGEAFAANGSLFYPGVQTLDTSQVYMTADASVALRWVLTDFGRTSRATRAAELAAKGAADGTRASERSAATQAALAYHVVLADVALREAAQETIRQRERQLEVTRALVASGLRSPVDLTRAEVALESARFDALAADATARQDGASLAAALALDPGTELSLAQPAEATVDDDPGRAVEAAVHRNDRVAQLRARALASRAQADAARAARYPSLEARGAVGARYTRGPQLDVASPSQQAMATFVLTVPLVDPAVSAATRSAEADAAIAEAELAAEVLAVRAEATKAALATAQARFLLARAEQLAAGARANLDQIETRYASGLVSPLELLDAQGADARARVTVIGARRDLELAKVRLLGVTGRL